MSVTKGRQWRRVFMSADSFLFSAGYPHLPHHRRHLIPKPINFCQAPRLNRFILTRQLLQCSPIPLNSYFSHGFKAERYLKSAQQACRLTLILAS